MKKNPKNQTAEVIRVDPKDAANLKTWKITTKWRKI